MRLITRISLLLPCLAVWPSSGAMAQDAGASAVLEEIVVTARRREESLQDAPISITAIEAGRLADFNILNLNELATRIPNVTVNDPGQNEPTLTIRGIGSSFLSDGIEQSVSMFIDGIYAGRNDQFRLPYFDLQRVEVVRGSQGVLFGKNAIAGAISVISARPTDDFTANVSASYDGKWDGWHIDGAFGGPIGDSNWTYRLAAKSQTDSEFMTNIGGDPSTSDDFQEPTVETTAARAMLNWESEDGRINFFTKFDYGKSDQVGMTGQIVAALPYFFEYTIDQDRGRQRLEAPNGPFIAPLEDSLDSTLNLSRSAGGLSSPFTEEFALTESQNWLAELTFETEGGYQFSSLTGYSTFDSGRAIDLDRLWSNDTDVWRDETFEQVSQEFKVVSPLSDTFDYLAGVFFLDREFEQFQLFSLTTPFGVSENAFYNETAETLSIYGQATWHMTPAWDLSVGVRYTDEQKDGERYNFLALLGQQTAALPGEIAFGFPGPGGPPPPFVIPTPNFIFQNCPDARTDFVAADMNGDGTIDPGEGGTLKRTRNEDSTDPQVTLRYQASEELSYYVSASRSHKAGGYGAQGFTCNVRSVETFEVDPETAETVELGLRSEWLDGRLRANVTLFSTDYKNLQVNTVTEAGSMLTNAGAVGADGLEFDGLLRVGDNITLGLGIGYLDAEFTDFPGGACPPPYNVNTPGFSASCLANAIAIDLGGGAGSNIDVPDDPATPFNELTYDTTFQDLTGRRPESAPEWSLSLYADMNFPLANGSSIQFSPDISYQDDVWLGQDHSPMVSQEAYWLASMRLAWMSADRKYSVALIGQNIFDERYIVAGGRIRVPGLYHGFVGRPETWSIEVNYRL